MSARRRRVNSDLDNDFSTTVVNNYHTVNSTFGGQNNNGRIDNWQSNNEDTDYFIPPIVMTSRDRSQEFSNAVKTMQGRTAIKAVGKSPSQARSFQSYKDFMTIAKNIGKNIASTYTKLEKLAILAKKKSIFDDRQVEIDELTHIIKTDLSSLNKQIGQLQELGKAQRETSPKSRHIASHSSSVVVALQSKLANMSNHFKSVLEVRTENMKEEQHRRQQFTQGRVTTKMPPSAMSGGQQSSLLLEEQDNSVSINLEPSMHQQTQMEKYMRDDTDQYVSSRAETMQNIESTIIELGGIFQQLAYMVKEQEEMVERIDTNVADTELNVEAAHTEILKYFQSVTNNRWLMIKIFGVLIFFFIFFVVFLA
ncbi:syntaxin-5 [Chelonus insularis]|uniref:syntaxin-5 n=1 Tax=Chelonus insularis TaxID=460826 RepID=UPI00158CEB78|nr:syntaxin-5 [Chelonus insularis]XP_034943999.1 syntaxin-5 [Chelonus insularis]XP_034944000.1 syntaxin-5 [Chelonus insularis]